MSAVPDELEILGQILIWAGVPLIVVTLLLTALTVVGWIRWGRSALRTGARLGDTFLDLVGSRDFPARRYLARCVVAMAFVIAVSYSFAQLAQVALEEGLDNGGYYSTRHVVNQMTVYDRWTPIARVVVIAMGAALSAAFSAALFSSLQSMRMITTPLAFASIAAAGAGCLVLIGGVAVFTQARAGEFGYTEDMSYLYLLSAFLLFSWAYGVYKFADLCDSLQKELARAKLMLRATRPQ